MLGEGHLVEYRFRTAGARQGVHGPESSPGFARVMPVSPAVPPAQPAASGDEVVHPARFAELLRAVAVLVLPAEQQVNWLIVRGEPLAADPLVLDLYENQVRVSAFRDAGWITERTAERLEVLAQAVQQLSGPANSGLWSVQALAGSDTWEHVRLLARSVLAGL